MSSLLVEVRDLGPVLFLVGVLVMVENPDGSHTVISGRSLPAARVGLSADSGRSQRLPRVCGVWFACVGNLSEGVREISPAMNPALAL
jgi:hypothetical protein